MSNDVTDKSWWQGTVEIDNLIYDEVILSSCYVEMRDGIKIAVDIYLPKGLNAKTKLPAILHQTRYFRRQKYNLISKILRFNKNIKRKIIDRFVKNGYAYINVDVRGSGASLGIRKMEWSPDEIKDGAELVEWITKQSWSNKKVAVVGMSYTATAAEMKLTNNHPAVKAAVIQYSLFDVYTDILKPGGIHNESFLKKWAMLNNFRDMNILPESITLLKKIFFRLLINGVAPVSNNREDLNLLRKAEKEHKKNYDIYSNCCKIKYRDDVLSDGITLDNFSPHMFSKEIESCGIPIYSWSGWYDGAYQRAAVNRYLNIKTTGSRLILGPWDHAGNHTADPFVQISKVKTYFDSIGEILRFLNLHLKNEKNGLELENPVHYFTVGENKWKEADTWPPEKFKYSKLILGQGTLLQRNQNTDDFSVYKSNQNATSGDSSRWTSQVNVEKKRITYDKIASQDSNRILFCSQPLLNDLEVTGHPVITLQVSTESPDLQIFTYLEEIENNGKVNYVTEGVFRTIHRKMSDKRRLYTTPYPWHSFKKEDSLDLEPGKITEISFDLLPVSYLFKTGNSIRVSITTSDTDNFETFPEKSTELKIYHNEGFTSCIKLPVKTILEF